MLIVVLCTTLGLALAAPNGYYHQEYNYRTSSQSYKNHELQHRNEDEGFYSKDGDFEGRFRPRVNAHSQHSEYVNPKIQHAYRMGTDRTNSFGQLNAEDRFRMGLGQEMTGFGFGAALPPQQQIYGIRSDLQQVTARLQAEMERELQKAVFDQYQQAAAYGEAITQTQLENDRRILEEELRRNVTMRLQEALKLHYGNQGIRGAYSYSITNGRLQPSANYNNQELADLTRRLEENLIRHLEQQVQNQYRVDTRVETTRNTYRTEGVDYPSPMIRPGYQYVEAQPQPQPLPAQSQHIPMQTQAQPIPMQTQPIPMQVQPMPMQPQPHPVAPIPDSITTVATRVQTELNEILNKILEDTRRRYFAENSYNAGINYDHILARLQDELRANITFHFDDQIKRAYGYTNYASKYSVEDIENLRRQIETNLMTKLNRDFTRQRDEYMQKMYIVRQPAIQHLEPMPVHHMQPVPANRVYVQNQDLTILQRQLQEQLSRQLQTALMEHNYRQAHMYSSAQFNPQATYQATLDQLTAELNRNLTRQIDLLNAQQYQSNIQEAQLAQIRNQLQHDLMRQLQQGLQQSYSRYSSWSASSSSSSSNYRPVRGFDPNAYRVYGGAASANMGEDCMMGDDPATYQQHSDDDLQQIQTDDDDLTQQVQTDDDLTQQVQTHDDLTQHVQSDEDLTQQVQTHDDLTQQVQTDDDLTQQVQTDDDLTQQVQTHDDLTQQVQKDDDLTQQVQTVDEDNLQQAGGSYHRKPLDSKPQHLEDFGQQVEDDDLTQQVQTHDDLTQQVQTDDDLTQQVQTDDDLTQQVQTHDDLMQQVQTDDDLTQQVQTVDEDIPQTTTRDNLQQIGSSYHRKPLDSKPQHLEDFGQQVEDDNLTQQVQTDDDLTQQVQTVDEDFVQTTTKYNLPQAASSYYRKPLDSKPQHLENFGQQVEDDDLTQQVQTNDDLTQQVQTNDDLTQQVQTNDDFTQQVQTNDDLTQQIETVDGGSYGKPSKPQYLEDLGQQQLESGDFTQQIQENQPLSQYQQSIKPQQQLDNVDLMQQNIEETQPNTYYFNSKPQHLENLGQQIENVDLTQQVQQPQTSYQQIVRQQQPQIYQSPYSAYTKPQQSQYLSSYSQIQPQQSYEYQPISRPESPYYPQRTYTLANPNSRYEQSPQYVSNYEWRRAQRQSGGRVNQAVQYYENIERNSRPSYSNAVRGSRPLNTYKPQQTQTLLGQQQQSDLTQQTQQSEFPPLQVGNQPQDTLAQQQAQIFTDQQITPISQQNQQNLDVTPMLSQQAQPINQETLTSPNLSQQTLGSPSLSQQSVSSPNLNQQAQPIGPNLSQQTLSSPNLNQQTQPSPSLGQQTQSFAQQEINQNQKQTALLPQSNQNLNIGRRTNPEQLRQAEIESQRLIDLLKQQQQRQISQTNQPINSGLIQQQQPLSNQPKPVYGQQTIEDDLSQQQQQPVYGQQTLDLTQQQEPFQPKPVYSQQNIGNGLTQQQEPIFGQQTLNEDLTQQPIQPNPLAYGQQQPVNTYRQNITPQLNYAQVHEINSEEPVKAIQPIQPQLADEVELVEPVGGSTTQKPGWWGRFKTSITNKLG